MENFEIIIPENYRKYNPSELMRFVKLNLESFLKIKRYEHFSVTRKFDSTNESLVASWYPDVAIMVSFTADHTSLKVESLNENPQSVSGVRTIKTFIENSF